MKSDQKFEEAEKPCVESSEEELEIEVDATSAEGEFKLSIRKLELPVRPRGVLAE